MQAVRPMLPEARTLAGTMNRYKGPLSFVSGDKRYSVTGHASGMLRERAQLYLPYNGSRALTFLRDINAVGCLPFSSFPLKNACLVNKKNEAAVMRLEKSGSFRGPEIMEVVPGDLPAGPRRMMEEARKEGTQTKLELYAEHQAPDATGNWISVASGLAEDGSKACLVRLADVFTINGMPFWPEKSISTGLPLDVEISYGTYSPSSAEARVLLPGDCAGFGSRDTVAASVDQLVWGNDYFGHTSDTRLMFRVNWPVGLLGISREDFTEGMHSLALPSADRSCRFSSSEQRTVWGRGLDEPHLLGFSIEVK